MESESVSYKSSMSVAPQFFKTKLFKYGAVVIPPSLLIPRFDFLLLYVFQPRCCCFSVWYNHKFISKYKRIALKCLCISNNLEFQRDMWWLFVEIIIFSRKYFKYFYVSKLFFCKISVPCRCGNWRRVKLWSFKLK